MSASLRKGLTHPAPCAQACGSECSRAAEDAKRDAALFSQPELAVRLTRLDQEGDPFFQRLQGTVNLKNARSKFCCGSKVALTVDQLKSASTTPTKVVQFPLPKSPHISNLPVTA